MKSPIRSRSLVIVVCLLGIHGTSCRCRADNKKPRIAPDSLRKYDVSKDIKQSEQPKKLRTLRPRVIAGYKKLSSALWSRRSTVAALLANGAKPHPR